MTTYNTYQEAKIAMPLACIIEDTDSGLFFGMPTREGTTLAGGSRFAEPQYYCISMLTFSELGHKLVDGDVYQNEDGRVFTVGNLGYEARYCNLLSSYCFPSKVFILRSAALENQMNTDNLATQTPEEKEVLDSIKSVHLRDYQKADKPHVKVEYELLCNSNFGIWGLKSLLEDGELFYSINGGFVVVPSNSDIFMIEHFLSGNIYRRIETAESPQQREERERLEAAYDLFCTGNKGLNVTAPCTFDAFESDEIQCKFWLAIVDKTNYRKESN